MRTLLFGLSSQYSGTPQKTVLDTFPWNTTCRLPTMCVPFPVKINNTPYTLIPVGRKIHKRVYGLVLSFIANTAKILKFLDPDGRWSTNHWQRLTILGKPLNLLKDRLRLIRSWIGRHHDEMEGGRSEMDWCSEYDQVRSLHNIVSTDSLSVGATSSLKLGFNGHGCNGYSYNDEIIYLSMHV
jgi:hypothetical protein